MAMDPTTPESETLEVDPPKPSKLRRFLKWLFIVASSFVVLLIVVFLGLLTYFFPSELVRQELETRSSELLQGEIHIAALSFNLLTGLELRQVEFLKQKQSLLKLQRLNLDYSLLGLFGGKFTLNEVLIDRADIALNLPELATSAPEDPAPPPPPLEEPSIPALPISIALDTLTINQSNFDIVVSPTLSVNLTNLNFDISGGVTQEEAELDGSLNIADIAISLEGKHVQLPLDVVFSLKANLPEQQLELRQLAIESNPAVRLALSGNIHEFLTKRKVDLSLHDVELDLKQLLLVAKDFVPPDFKNLKVSGLFSPTLHIQGSLPESEFQGKVNLTLKGKNIEADLSPLETNLRSTDFSIEASDVSIRDNFPQFGTIKVNVANTGTQFQNYSVRDFHLDLTSEYFDAGPLSGTLQLSGVSTIPPIGPLEGQTLPIRLQLEANGNHKSQDLVLKEMIVKLGDLLLLQARGEIHSPTSTPQGMNVSLVTRLEPNIASLLPLVPPDMLEGITVQKGTGPDVIVVNMNGLLNEDYLPEWAKLSTGVKLTSMTTALDAMKAGGRLDRANVLVSASYSRSSGQIQGTVGTSLKLSDLHQGGSLAIGQTELRLKTSIAGALSPEFELTNLRSQDMVTIKMADIVYDDPSLKASLDQILVSSKTNEDIFSQDYRLERLHVTSGPLFDVTVKGQYQMTEQQFSAHVDIPFINVEGLLGSLSGNLVQGLGEIKPQGRIALSANTSGRVPTQAELDQLAIPVDALATVTLQNVEGAFAQHQVKGAGGTLSVSFTSGDHPIAKLSTDVQVKGIQLAPGLPLERLSDAYVKLNVSARDFDEIQMDQLRVGVAGADLDASSTVTGVKGMLTGNKALGSILGKLFAQVKTQVSVDLGQFEDVLKPAGLIGSGQATIGIAMLKKEEGPFDASLSVATENINIKQDGNTIRNIDGGLSLRKNLAWNPTSAKKPFSRLFNPSDALSQLRSHTNKWKRISIEDIDLGFLTISNFATHILFDRNTFKIQNLAMNLLGGGLGGNVILTTGKTFGVATQLEAARLDLNQLLEEEKRISGDSLVDATIGMGVFFEEETGALDLSRTELNFYITHIGQEALDRILVFLDPEDSNPTLVSARSQVKLANPSRVVIQIARGMMSLEILFGQGLLSDFKMDRVPVGSIKNLQMVTQGIPNWETITQVLALVGAETYGIDPDGNVLFQ